MGASLLAMLVLVLHQIPTEAQAAAEITVSPPVDYLQIKPGSRTAHTITVENSGTESLSLRPSIVDFIPSQETGLPILQQSHSFPYFENEAAVLQSTTLAPGQKAQLTLTIVVPSSATPAEYHLTALFSGTSGAFGTAGNSGLAATVGSNIIILISGENQHQPALTIDTIRTPRIIDSFSPLEVIPVAQNTRFAASTASGSATIRNWRGQVVAKYSLYPDVVLGFSSRPLRGLAGTAEEPVPVPLKHKPLLLLGPYFITVTLTNTSTTQLVTEVAQRTVWAIPLAVTVASMVALLVFLGYRFYQGHQDRAPLDE